MITKPKSDSNQILFKTGDDVPEKQEEENENNGGDENEQIKSGFEDDFELKEHDNSSLKGIGLYQNCLLTTVTALL